MKNIIAILMFDLFLPNFTFGQELQWIKGWEYFTPSKILLDDTGNSYHCGLALSASQDLDPGPGNFPINNQEGLAVVKLDPNGNTIWIKHIEGISGTSTTGGRGFSLDANGNIFLSGEISSTVDADPGSGVFNISPNVTTNHDQIIIKLDINGDFVWAKSIPSYQGGKYEAFHVDQNGNLILSSKFVGTIDLDPGVGVYNAISTDLTSFFILKLDSDGNFIWAHTFNNIDDASNNWINYPEFITTDSDQNIYLTGSFADSCDFDPSMSENFLSTPFQPHSFLLKLSSNGEFVWAKSWGDSVISGGNEGEGISIYNDQLYVTGRTYGWADIDFDPGVGEHIVTTNEAMYILHLDTAGNFNSVYSVNQAIPYLIHAESFNEIYCWGRNSASFNQDWDPGTGVLQMSYGGFILKLKNTHELDWGISLGGSSTFNFAGGISIDGGIHSGGQGGGGDFDPGIDSITPNPSGDYTAKYNETLNVISYISEGSYSIFPNPNDGSSINTNFKYSAVQVYDLKGNLLMSSSNLNSIHVSSAVCILVFYDNSNIEIARFKITFL